MNKELIERVDKKIEKYLKKIDELEAYNSKLVLDAFRKFQVSESDFKATTGYGYGDTGRDKIEKIFAYILDAEKALVRSQFISGTHALTTTFFGLLRPNDTLLAITGKPYDTLDEVIGIKENKSSLAAFGINYQQIDLLDNDFNYQELISYLKEKSL